MKRRACGGRGRVLISGRRAKLRVSAISSDLHRLREPSFLESQSPLPFHTPVVTPVVTAHTYCPLPAALWRIAPLQTHTASSLSTLLHADLLLKWCAAAAAGCQSSRPVTGVSFPKGRPQGVQAGHSSGASCSHRCMLAEGLQAAAQRGRLGRAQGS